ncbi:hypothetical protein D3C81_1975650 [compost metagenome]
MRLLFECGHQLFRGVILGGWASVMAKTADAIFFQRFAYRCFLFSDPTVNFVVIKERPEVILEGR